MQACEAQQKTQLDWREPNRGDLEACLEIQPELFGPDKLRGSRAAAIWERLLKGSGFKGVALTRQNGATPNRLSGFGASVFVDDAFAKREIENPRPGLNGRIIQSIFDPHSIIYDRQKIAEANSNEGVNVAVLCGRWNPCLADESEKLVARLMLATSFAELHLGYRFKRVLIELVDAQDRLFQSEVPFMRIVKEFDRGRALGIIEREDVLKNQGSILGTHFFCPSPHFGFNEIEQDLLAAAWYGGTDEFLAAKLGVTKRAVKRRWMAIFERIMDLEPSFFLHSQKKAVRGPQKRHLVMELIRKHPEELRPFMCSVRAKGMSDRS